MGLTLFTMQTTKPFSSMLYEATVSSSFKILPRVLVRNGGACEAGFDRPHLSR